MSADPLPSTSASRTCRTCGGSLPPDAPGGNCPACLWELVSKPPEDDGLQGGGRRIGSYLLIGELARGGMGAVWRARHEGLGREVALKLILGDRLATTEQVIRFHTEARAAARLDHPNIVPIYEIGEDDGRHFYTMHLVEEGSLADRMQRGPPLSPRESARIVALTARAIHFAHQRGVLHRDVKPSNILLDEDLEPRVGDFGLARTAIRQRVMASCRPSTNDGVGPTWIVCSLPSPSSERAASEDVELLHVFAKIQRFFRPATRFHTTITTWPSGRRKM